MTLDMQFENIQKFLETKPASKTLMSYLDSKAEIGIVIGNTLECSYFKQDGQPKFEKRKPHSPDVVFHFTPEATETLLKTNGNELSDLVADVAKLYLAGSVKIRLPGSLPALLIRGYARIIKSCHAQLLALLKDHGVNNLKILSLFEKLKSMK